MNLLTEVMHLFYKLPLQESIKWLISQLASLFAIIQLSFLCYNTCGKKNGLPSKFALLATFSILLTPFATTQGMALISFFLPSLNHLSERTLFIVNPWHLKHLLSFLTFFLSFFVFLKAIYNFKTNKETGLSTWTFLVVSFNAFTARPLLHVLHQLSA